MVIQSRNEMFTFETQASQLEQGSPQILKRLKEIDKSRMVCHLLSSLNCIH